MLHFPSGAESEINQRLMEKFAALGVNAWLDRANNARTLIPDRNRQKPIGITAHKKYAIGALENVGLISIPVTPFGMGSGESGVGSRGIWN